MCLRSHHNWQFHFLLLIHHVAMACTLLSCTEHLDYFQSKGIPLINASPIGMGLLATAPLQSWHPASSDIKEACAKAVKYCEAEGVDISHTLITIMTSILLDLKR